MAVYRSSLDTPNVGQTVRFFDTLIGCLAGICREGRIASVALAPSIDPPKDNHDGWNGRCMKYERDMLLLHKGTPLLAVFLQYRCGGGPNDDDAAGYVTAPSYAGPSLREVQHSLAERLRAATPEEEKEPVKPAFTEGKWTMILRALDLPVPLVFQGSPLDIDAVDLAFTAMVDQLVARINKA